ncbi:MAG: copper chaperone PCu(A)C [Hyphomonadaceae bacterium]
MLRTIILIGATGLALSACSPSAPPSAEQASEHAAETPGISVSEAWAAVTPNGATVGAGYMTISNVGPADTLVSATSPRAQSVELHEMSMDGNVMRMRPVTSFTVPADGVVSLTPNGLHLMLTGLTGPLVAGETVPLTLTFERAGVVEVSLPVRERTASEAEMQHEHH